MKTCLQCGDRYFIGPSDLDYFEWCESCGGKLTLAETYKEKRAIYLKEMKKKRIADLQALNGDHNIFECPWCLEAGEFALHHINEAGARLFGTNKILCDGCASVGEPV